MCHGKIIFNKSLFCILAFFCSILYLLSGCATTNPNSFSSPIPENVRRQIRQVAIVPAKFTPQINYHPFFAKGRDVGAAKGAANGAVTGALWGIGATGGTGGFGAILLPFFIAGGAVLGGTGGGIGGALASVPEENAKQIEEAVDNALVKLDIQGTMAEHILRSGNDFTKYKYTIFKGIGPGSREEISDYRNLNLEGIDIILEVSVISLGFKGGKGSNPSISFDMKVNVRAIDVTNVEEVYSEITEYVSRERRLSEWMENNAQEVQDEFEHCYQSLAEDIIEKIFLLYEFYVIPQRDPSWHCMLQPFYPELKYGFFSTKLKYPEVDSLQPTLKWEPFPREKDINEDKKGILTRINEITYDLKIWSEQDFIQDEPLYIRQGIERAEHKIEILLEQSKRYFWTFRAGFKLDGQYRVTKWAQSRIPWKGGDPCYFDYIPVTHYYRFKTPSK